MATSAKTSPRENPGLLLMLDRDATLQALIATWPNAYRAGAKRHEQIAKWAELTGLRPVEIEAAWPKLFENGFVSRDGTVDEYAKKYLGSLAMAKLPASARPKPKPEKKEDGS